MAAEDAQLLAGGGVPQPGGLVPYAVRTRAPSGENTAEKTGALVAGRARRSVCAASAISTRRRCRDPRPVRRVETVRHGRAQPEAPQ